MNNKYILVKDPRTEEAVYINYTKDIGLEFKPKTASKEQGIRVNSLILFKPSFVEKILKKKIKRNLDAYLQEFISTIDEDESEDDTNLRIVLDDIERLKRKLKNKYRKYLEEKYIMLLNKKLLLLENEIKGKILDISMKSELSVEPEVEEEELRRSR